VASQPGILGQTAEPDQALTVSGHLGLSAPVAVAAAVMFIPVIEQLIHSTLWSAQAGFGPYYTLIVVPAVAHVTPLAHSIAPWATMVAP
jgi:hypothetical protein